MLRIILSALVRCGLATLLGAAPAAALSVLCSGSCPVQGAIPNHQGSPFDFTSGIRAEEAERIDLLVAGSLYIFGDITTNGADVELTANGSIEIGAIQISVNDGNLVLNSGDLLLPIPSPIPGPIAGGGIPIPEGPGGVTISVQALLTAALLPPASLVSEFSGDVFLDLAGVTLNGLKAVVSGDIVVSRINPIVTPEPRAVLLIGCGLGILATQRRLPLACAR